MKYGTLDITAPQLTGQPFNEAAMLGAAAWLWMHSDMHRSAPLHTLPTTLLPALKHRQFILASEGEKPVFFLSWALFSEAAERRYLANLPACMPVEDWASGDRMWILDWVAPFGHTRSLRHLVTRLFADRCFRALQHRGKERGLRVMEFKGIAVMADEARAWFETHPIASAQEPISSKCRLPESPQ
jgi:cytolysin-activating lysine-acyltransferase